MTNKELYDRFLVELDRSLVVDAKTKEYWLQNYKKLPVTAVDFFYSQLMNANKRVDNMIAVGIDADPALGQLIVQKGKDAKKKGLFFQEKQDSKEENPEEFLKASLS